MLLPDCKCCSGFFAVICLLPFFLLLLPPLFPPYLAAVSVVVLSAVSAGLALFPFCSHCCFCRCSFCCPGCSCAVPVALPAAFLSLPSPNFPCLPCALSRPGQHPGSPRSGHATRIGGYTKGRCKIALQRPRCRNVFVMPHPAGESYGRWPGKSCGGACPAYFAWAPVIPAWFGCRGGQAWTSTGYGFGRKRVSAPYFPTGALRSRLFSKGILPAATVFCTRNCGGRNPASSW